MKVLLINGSTRRNGCVYTALGEIAGVLNKEGVETEILQMSSRPVYDCKACGYCENGAMQCAVKDDYVNEWIKKAAAADGFVVGSPVYYAHPTGQLLSVPDRMFYAAMDAFRYKPAASVVTARRAGTTASPDVINKFFSGRLYADSVLHLPEHGARQFARTDKERRRRFADHAQYRLKYGVAA